jgi:hypothetical protein
MKVLFMLKKMLSAFAISVLLPLTVSAQEASSAAAATTASPPAQQSEIEALRQREQQLRQREEAIRQREEAIRRRENTRVIDRTNLSRELEARAERQRLQSKRNKIKNLNYKYSVGLFGGLSLLTNPNKLDYSSKSLLGANFGATFLYAIDNKLNVKIGLDLVYATMLDKFTISSPTHSYSVNTKGMFIMVHGRYEFLKRNDGEMFIPWAGVSLGFLIPSQTGVGASNGKSFTTAYGIAVGFDIYFQERMSLGLQLKVYASKYAVVPDYAYSGTKTLIFFLPSLGVTFSF